MKLKCILFALLVSAVFQLAYSQNVGINSTGATPANCAMLDIVSTDKGLLIPRVVLTSVSTYAPLTGTAVDGLLVYSSAVPTGGNGKGYYYWSTSASRWINLIDNDSPGNPWYLNGNTSNTTPAAPVTYGTSTIGAAEHYLGTTDANDIVFGTNNIERMRVKQTTGFTGIGLAAPTAQLEVLSSGLNNGVYGHSSNVGGYLGRETNITFGTPLQTLQGAGLYAANPAAGYTSSFAQSTGLADVAANINFSSVWMATYNYVENAASSTFNPPTIYGQLNNSSTTLTGYQAAIRGYSNRGTATGNPGYTIGGNFTANSQNQDAFGVLGQAYTNSTTRAGGYFEALNYAGTSQAFAYVGTSFGGVNRKITGTNAVSEIVPTKNHGRITLTAPESPEYWYQDYGTVELVNGKAHVDLDPILADIIVVNKENPIRVFCTPVDMLYYNGVAIVNKTSTGFDVVEINGGTHSGTIDYQIVVKPKTGYGEGRFHQAPGPAWLKSDLEPASAKAKNQPQGRDIFYWPVDWEVYGYDVEKVIGIGDIVPAGPNRGKFKVAEGVFMEQMPAQKPKK